MWRKNWVWHIPPSQLHVCVCVCACWVPLLMGVDPVDSGQRHYVGEHCCVCSTGRVQLRSTVASPGDPAQHADLPGSWWLSRSHHNHPLSHAGHLTNHRGQQALTHAGLPKQMWVETHVHVHIHTHTHWQNWLCPSLTAGHKLACRIILVVTVILVTLLMDFKWSRLCFISHAFPFVATGRFRA